MLLLLLDLSVVFDAVNHSLLLSLLENSFGMSGTVLHWFHSYLCLADLSLLKLMIQN